MACGTGKDGAGKEGAGGELNEGPYGGIGGGEVGSENIGCVDGMCSCGGGVGAEGWASGIVGGI